MTRARVIWSAVQSVTLTIAVGACAFMLLRGTSGPGGVYVIGVTCFGLALIGHLTVLVIARRSRTAAAPPKETDVS